MASGVWRCDTIQKGTCVCSDDAYVNRWFTQHVLQNTAAFDSEGRLRVVSYAGDGSCLVMNKLNDGIAFTKVDVWFVVYLSRKIEVVVDSKYIWQRRNQIRPENKVIC